MEPFPAANSDMNIEIVLPQDMELSDRKIELLAPDHETDSGNREKQKSTALLSALARRLMDVKRICHSTYESPPERLSDP